ncbi:hypothetical protein D3C75_232960 [compost metagenome]
MAKGVQIGVSNLVYALLLADPAPGEGTPTYGPAKRLPGVMTANINPNSSSETLFADNGPYETASTIGSIGLELGVAEISLEDQAVLLGSVIEGGVMVNTSEDIPPWVAIGFKSLKSNGSSRYTWLTKGKFAIPEQNNETKGDAVNFQTPTISGSFAKLDNNNQWRRMIDEDSLDFYPGLAENWFVGPYGTGGGGTALTVTAAVTRTSMVWTFNTELARSTVTTNNFIVTLANGTAVAGTLTISTDRKVVTFTPTTAVAAGAEVTTIVTTGVTSMSGVRLAAPKVQNDTV